MTALVSIIVPIYNIADEYLNKCLNTLQNQTYKNIEIIAVIDGSPNENNQLLCEYFHSKDNRFKVVTQPNSGVSVARNNGLKAARGEWIAFVDPDDWLSLEYVEVLLSNATSDTEIVVCDCYVEYENKSVVNHFYPKSVSANNIKLISIEEIFGRNKLYNPPEIAIGVPWGKMYNHNFIQEKKLNFDFKLRRMQDNIFNLYAFDAASKISYIDMPLYHYRKYGESVSSRFSTKIFDDFYHVFEATDAFVSSKKKNIHKYKQLYYKRILQSIVPFCKFYFFNKKNNNSYEKNKKIFLEIVESKFYQDAIHNIEIDNLDLNMKVLFMLIKYRLFMMLKLAFKIRHLLQGVK